MCFRVFIGVMNMEILKSKKFENAVQTIIGGFIMGFALIFFLVPSDIAAGGVSGISTVLHYLFDLPVGIMVLVLNIPIFILGFVNFDSRFLITSIIGTLALSLSTQFFESDFFAAFLPVSNDMFLCSVMGGVLYGFGLGLALRSGGTTGGTDILSLVLKKWFPKFSVGQFIIIIDGVIVAGAGLAFGRLDTILYSAVMLFVSSTLADMMIDGVDFAKMVYIISEKEPEISRKIAEEVGRGSTALSGFSMYSGKTRNVLMCVMRKYQLPKLKEIVREEDDEAFVIVSDVKEVLGYGFRYKNRV